MGKQLTKTLTLTILATAFILLSTIGLLPLTLFLLLLGGIIVFIYPRVPPLKKQIYAHKVSLTITAIAALLGSIYLSGKIAVFEDALLPPHLPTEHRIAEQVQWLEQNWDAETRIRYYYTSQGTQTLPLPYEWFINLEQPANSLLGIASSDGNKKLIDPDYMARLGFIPADNSPAHKLLQAKYNPDNLPIGVVKSPNINISGLPGKRNAIGLNCAACHTGVMSYADTSFVIDGGSAHVDTGLLQAALGKALAQTIVSAKVPLIGARFDTFAKNILGKRDTPSHRQQLIKDMTAFTEFWMEALVDPVAITEGFGRLDALNRIGNQVFAIAPQRAENLAAIDSPVNYPHIWTAGWFDWVQYDASIMNPLVRNTGQALGVRATVNYTAHPDKGRFASSAPIPHLVWIENVLSGDQFPPKEMNKGLTAPSWPTEVLGEIDQKLAATGKALYKKHCMRCHLPPLDTIQANSKHLQPIVWRDLEGKEHRTEKSVLKLKVVPQPRIGTDPAQHNVLLHRTVNTAGNKEDSTQIKPNKTIATAAMQLETTLCAPQYSSEHSYAAKPKQNTSLTEFNFTDSPEAPYAFALAAVINKTLDAWQLNNTIDAKTLAAYKTDRPNCLQAGAGYKARPLNGIWATPPYLHNGSVPSLWDLLTPEQERPKVLQLGHNEFDAKKLGIKQSTQIALNASSDYSAEGLFLLDTRIPGNKNTGHNFSANSPDKKTWPNGVIGVKLTDDEKWAIIEYVKTL